jgi:energy-coupling factor transport system permease protein
MYVSAGSRLHRLDPRVKMGAALLLTAIPFAAHSVPSIVLLTAFVAAVAFLSAVPGLALLRTLRTVFWLAFVMFFFYLFTTPGRMLIAVGPVGITWEGVLAGALQIYRVCLLVIVASLLTFTTSPSQLTHGLDALLRPLERIGLPVRELTMVLTIALRFVPTLMSEIDKITKAQQTRGADIRSGGPWHRIRSWVPIFVPIFVAAFRRAEELATAMEARGFRGARRRTRLHQLRLGWGDLVAALATLGMAAAILALERAA